MGVASIPERTRISADRYQKMVATGVLTKYDRVELIHGDIIDVPPNGLNPAAATARLNRPRADYYARQIPTADDILLLVEISDSSLAFDQGAKRALHARHGVVEYWIVDLPGKCMHVYREPAAGGYARTLACTANDGVSPQAVPAIRLAVGTLFT